MDKWASSGEGFQSRRTTLYTIRNTTTITQSPVNVTRPRQASKAGGGGRVLCKRAIRRQTEKEKGKE